MEKPKPASAKVTGPVKNKPKAKYSPPKLTDYGTIRDLTKTVATHGSFDGGSPRNTNFTAVN